MADSGSDYESDASDDFLGGPRINLGLFGTAGNISLSDDDDTEEQQVEAGDDAVVSDDFETVNLEVTVWSDNEDLALLNNVQQEILPPGCPGGGDGDGAPDDPDDDDDSSGEEINFPEPPEGEGLDINIDTQDFVQSSGDEDREGDDVSDEDEDEVYGPMPMLSEEELDALSGRHLFRHLALRFCMEMTMHSASHEAKIDFFRFMQTWGPRIARLQASGHMRGYKSARRISEKILPQPVVEAIFRDTHRERFVKQEPGPCLKTNIFYHPRYEPVTETVSQSVQSIIKQHRGHAHASGMQCHTVARFSTDGVQGKFLELH